LAARAWAVARVLSRSARLLLQDDQLLDEQSVLVAGDDDLLLHRAEGFGLGPQDEEPAATCDEHEAD